jgi:hypothetical protein
MLIVIASANYVRVNVGTNVHIGAYVGVALVFALTNAGCWC